jgi:hypothetical protein
MRFPLKPSKNSIYFGDFPLPYMRIATKGSLLKGLRTAYPES